MCTAPDDERESGPHGTAREAGAGARPLDGRSVAGSVVDSFAGADRHRVRTEDDTDPRLRSAWRSWLSALATDAEAAMAAALAYESLPDEGRDAWLDALDDDAPTLRVPKIALYAPLLAVESQLERRARIEASLDESDRGASGESRSVHSSDSLGTFADPADEELAPVSSSRQTRALRGIAPDGKHVCMILSPLYLDFVQVLICRYTPHGGFVAVKHDPLRHAAEVPHGSSSEVDGVAVEDTPLRVVVEELAHAVLADRRARREAPPALTHFAHLFGPHLDDGDRSE